MPKVTSRPAAATIADVAEAAGVSRATVSRVMNGRSTVGETITARVKAVAEELQYRPSNVARSLSLGRTETVALVVPDLANPMFQHVLSGITDAAAAHGYRVLVADTAEKPEDEAEIALDARLRCDALVMVSPRMPQDQLAALIRQASPMVLVNRESPDPAVPSVTVNYRTGMAAVLTHLVSLGHRRVVYLAGPPARLLRRPPPRRTARGPGRTPRPRDRRHRRRGDRRRGLRGTRSRPRRACHGCGGLQRPRGVRPAGRPQPGRSGRSQGHVRHRLRRHRTRAVLDAVPHHRRRPAGSNSAGTHGRSLHAVIENQSGRTSPTRALSLGSRYAPVPARCHAASPRAASPPRPRLRHPSRPMP
ncbi:LacI family DNA-binding transcriptional regulator [Demequina litorisediminis]|uniref:LacI family DNA-binding transcriptional regulator n=1 Tax=Demequina litorisediminis TaxID=1849022 RepID=UPI003D67DA18